MRTYSVGTSLAAGSVVANARVPQNQRPRPVRGARSAPRPASGARSAPRPASWGPWDLANNEPMAHSGCQHPAKGVASRDISWPGEDAESGPRAELVKASEPASVMKRFFGFSPSPLLIALAVSLLATACEDPPAQASQNSAPTPTLDQADVRGATGAEAAAIDLPADPSADTDAEPAPEARTEAAAAQPAGAAGAEPAIPTVDFVVTRVSTGIYPDLGGNRRSKLGYARRGAKLSVIPDPIPTAECTEGWFALAGSAAYVCSSHGTTNPNHHQFRHPARQPDTTQPLPYTYLRNSKHGTPLYRSVPAEDQLFEYEPYLRPAPKPDSDSDSDSGETDKRPDAAASASSAPADGVVPVNGQQPASDGDGAATDPSDSTEPQVAWWQRENIKETLHELTLEELEAERDEVLMTRLVRGFYVAVDRNFAWNGRRYAKTTRGLIAPQERFWRTKASEFQGVELSGAWDLPVAWVYGRKDAQTFDIDLETNVVKSRDHKLKKFSQLHLTGRETTIQGKDYSELIDGSWMRTYYIRETNPGPVPEDLVPGEHWIDVNIKEQTLVAYDGATPVYATMVSSGRKDEKNKELDHTTPVGQYRVREKHVTATMDGNGSAAGELPYSIEDVPYVMYYHKSYAVHAAFWHENYGVRMSHGCVNLSPLDARHIFKFAGPQIPEGWHGAWASERNPGTRVVVHDGSPPEVVPAGTPENVAGAPRPADG